MNDTTTWYQLEADYTGKGFKIVPLEVISQTPKTILTRETWEETHWQKKGSRTRRVTFNGNQFDNWDAAYLAGVARLDRRITAAKKAVIHAENESKAFGEIVQ